MEDQIEAQYSAIQSRINELEPGKLRAYNELLSKYVAVVVFTHYTVHYTTLAYPAYSVSTFCLFVSYYAIVIEISNQYQGTFRCYLIEMNDFFLTVITTSLDYACVCVCVCFFGLCMQAKGVSRQDDALRKQIK